MTGRSGLARGGEPAGEPVPRVALVEPPFGEPKAAPIGLLYLATVARARGFPVDLHCQSPRRRRSVDGLVDGLAREPYQVVGVSAMTPTLPVALAILRQVKRIRPGTLGVLGGYHATLAHDRVLRNHAEVDVVVRGEGEETLVELLERVRDGADLRGVAGLSFRDGEQVVVNEPRPQIADLDSLPFPDRALAPAFQEYAREADGERGRSLTRANVCSSRGCPYGCSFCVLGSDDPGSATSLRRWRARSAENVVAEIAQLRGDGVEAISFLEDNFAVSARRLERFAELVLARGLEIRFSFDARANQICRLGELLARLRLAGLRRIEVGVESASQSVLDRLAKGTRVEDNRRALALLAANRIRPRINFLMFEPLSDLCDLEQNLAFLSACAPPGYDHHRTVYQKLELHPGTELQRRYRALGLASGDPDEVLAYEFRSPEVGGLYRVLDRFYWDHQMRIDDMKKAAHFLLADLDTPRTRELRGRVARDLVFLLLPANRLPLRLLAACLEAARSSRAGLERAVRPFEARAAGLVEGYEQLLRDHGLERYRDPEARAAAPVAAGDPGAP